MTRRAALLAVLALVLTGCGVGAADLPLPGTSVGGDTYRLSADFDDALNLPVGAPVKLHGVPIGKVRTVESRDFTAHVEMDLRSANRLHRGTTARLRSTTPLGELFVQVDDAGSGSVLADGATLGTDATSTAPSIEDSMAATSMLLNGGNLGQLGTIIKQTNAALDGRDLTARDLLKRLTTTAAAFESSTKDITRVLNALDSVSAQLDDRTDTIDAALRDVAPAAAVLRRNTAALTDLLAGITDLGTVSRRVIAETHDDFLRILDQAGPILDQLLSIRTELGPGLRDLVRLADLLDRGVPTDYLNVYMYLDDSVKLGPASQPEQNELGGVGGISPPPLPDLGGLLQPGNDGLPDIGLGGLLGRLGGGS